jgi:HK97 family phage major capsid protein
MPNVVLERLRQQRAEQIATIDAILEQVGDDRDLVDAERSLLEAARKRIGEIDEQIQPLAAFESTREAHDETVRALPRPEAGRVPAAARAPECPYTTPGAFVVDYLRANGLVDGSGVRGRDEQAAARVQQAYQVRADQTTADTPGLLPTPIVGTVVSLIDANRPLISSLGARPLGGIPGLTFQRPKITQHVTVGQQTAEKTALPSQKMTITPINFTKQTYGGSVDVSRQDIDFTSPAAWDILVRDLADVYAVSTETAVAANVVADAGTPVVLGGATLQDWTKALYTAAMHSYQIGKRMPDRVFCALDVWAALGSLVDVARPAFPPGGNLDTAAGESSMADFRGDVLGLPRVVVPTFAAGTCIVGPSQLYEVYEDVIGLLSVIEPSILGVEVAYGGYIADGTTTGAAFIPITTTAGGLPTLADDEPGPANSGRKAAEK